jgi:adenylate cyclase
MQRAPYTAPLIAGLVFFSAVIGARELGWLQGLELALHDAYAHNTVRTDEHRPDVVMLYVTEGDIRELGHWPISDRELARALQLLVDGGARIIGLDIYRDLPVPPGEANLEALLQSHSNIIAVHKFGEPDADGISGPWPLRALSSPSREGFNDVIPDTNGRVRRGLLFMDDGSGGPVDYAFALRIALLALSREGTFPAADPEHRDWMRLGAATFRPFEGRDGGYVRADDAGYQILLNSSRDHAGLSSFDLLTLLEGDVDPELIRDRIVMVGSNAQSLRDFFHLPSTGADEQVAGIALHGHIVQQLLDSARGRLATIRVLSEWQETSLVLALVVIGSAMGLGVRWLGMGPTSIAGVALVGFWSVAWGGLVAYGSSLWIPMVGPSLAWTSTFLATSVWTSSRDRALREALVQLVPDSTTPELARDLWRRRAGLFASRDPQPIRLKASILVLQMEGPAAEVEKLHPAQLVEWLDGLMSPLLELVGRHHGTTEVFSGDGLRATFGAPVPGHSEEEFARDARNAVLCAVGMANVLESINTRHWQQGLPAATLRVGINTGWVVGGGLGRKQALAGKHVLTGAEVFTARRLAADESVVHDFEHNPCLTLLSDTTHGYLNQMIATERLGPLVFRDSDQVIYAHRVTDQRTT